MHIFSIFLPQMSRCSKKIYNTRFVSTQSLACMISWPVSLNWPNCIFSILYSTQAIEKDHFEVEKNHNILSLYEWSWAAVAPQHFIQSHPTHQLTESLLDFQWLVSKVTFTRAGLRLSQFLARYILTVSTPISINTSRL